MIVSHKHQFIFIAVPKTGTHAVRQALRPHLGDQDEEQVGLFVQKKLNNEKLSAIKHGHISCLQAREALGEEIWNNYFKFAFVRNPWDRYISFCAFMHRKNPKFQRTPELFLRRMIEKPEIQQRILFRPQAELLCDEQNEIMLDFVGKHESFQQDFDHICEQIGVPSSLLENVNASQHKHYKDYYNSQLIERVRQFYQLDIQAFSYIFDAD